MIAIHRRKSLRLRTTLLLSYFILHTSSFSQTPSQQLIPFQGRLTNQQGEPYNSGQFSITFNLYSPAVGGPTLWTERHEKVGVTNGMVNVFLGSIIALNTVDFSTVKYLGITVDADNNPATADPEMVPRQMIIPAFWAKQAENANKLAGNDWSSIIVDGSNAASNNPTTGFLKGSKLSAGSITSSQLASNLTLNLAATTAAGVGTINQNGSSLLQTYGSRNFFAGPSAGNFAMTGANNIGVGSQALQSNTIGQGNLAIGLQTLVNNTTGDYNVALGIGALFGNTGGGKNTATGVSALSSNTTGGNNTATGYSALLSNKTGPLNTASGYNTMANNIDGAQNTATGAEALFSNTSGSGNTAIGFQALYKNIDGTANTASGQNALYFNTAGIYNTASGYQALQDNRTGNSNTALGLQALLRNNTGHENTAIGQQALTTNTTGRNNIALGILAGANLTTGSYNIDIGHQGVAGESNTIRLGTQGTQMAMYVAGISGSVLGTGSQPVGVDSSGKLGTPPPRSLRYQNGANPGDIVVSSSSGGANAVVGAETDVPGQTLTIHTRGGPVIIGLSPTSLAVHGTGSSTSTVGCYGVDVNSKTYFRLYRNNTLVGTLSILPHAGVTASYSTAAFPPGAITFSDQPTATTTTPHTYRLTVQSVGNGGGWLVENCALMAVEQ